MYKDWLKGTWKLVSFTSTDEIGNITDAMGAGATGFLSYTDDDWVSVQLMKPDRLKYDISDIDGGTVEQTVSAAQGLFCYAGTFIADDDNSVVYHNLEFSLIPNWIGTKQKRYIQKINENEMELSGDPVPIGGKIQTTRLRWVRIAPKKIN